VIKNRQKHVALRAQAHMKRGVEEQHEFMTKAATHFEDAGREFMHSAAEKTQNMLTVMTPSGLHDAEGFMGDLVQGVIRTNLRLAQEMFQVRSPQAFIELQMRFMQEYFEAFQQGAAAMMRVAGLPAKPSAV
jgi:hypothetical protein